ncbi:MAG TPA: excinuclease ABC subunit UvrA [Candidatus Margulisiibacteriota bacterium]|nr:excinuclease ABC subunit UvrA [Candidatus Margulisiibacteriota bacterium]
MAQYITVTGARQHNLKNITVEIPRDKLVVITGLSGSGKSSLAFDTIYAEGQRRYVESLSAYARQFLEQMEKPDVDSIDGLSPAISIEQKTTSKNPRSTVGTVTEIYDYLRLLFARIGKPYCYNCGREITPQTIQQIVDRIMTLPASSRIHVLAPIIRGRKGEYRKELVDLRKAGFVRARIDGTLRDLADDIVLAKNNKHTIEVLVDRLVIRDGLQKRLADSLEVAFRYGAEVAKIEVLGDGGDGVQAEILFSQKFACVVCGISYPELTPRMFSFNNPHGACATCSGLGTTMYFDPELIVPNEDLSLAQGAVAPWVKKTGGQFYQHVWPALARHFRISVDTPFKKLPQKVKDAIFHGTEEELTFVHEKGTRRYEFKRPFEGVIANLDRRLKETDSEWMREELEAFMNVRPCPACQGARLKREALAVRLHGKSIMEVTALSVKEAWAFFSNLTLTRQEEDIARRILKEIVERLGFMTNVGLDYLSLERTAASLSGGEAQRIRLATQIGSSLVGVLYILDEPSIGLHQRDNARLLATLKRLRDLGNTVLVVEHDRDAILDADHVIDMGPGAGVQGGYIVAHGTPTEIAANPNSLTGKYLSGALDIPIPSQRRTGNGWTLTIKGARQNNLQNVTVSIPLGTMTCVTGVSGSGKSSLVIDTLYRALAHRFYGAKEKPGAHDEIKGWQLLDKVIDIDQAPIGRTPRSNPATYTGLFTHIRDLFAQLPEARVRGYGPGRFSFNVKGGRCEACAGDGMIKIEMHFLPDVFVTCEVCGGRRYNRETLEVHYKGKSIAEVLDMTVGQAVEFLANVPAIRQKLATLRDVGLDYIHLGQSATTLSGGEAQRIKLAKELSRRATGKTLYILDEPTTGLHFDDIKRLLSVLSRLADAGNTVVIIEHNLDVIKTADHVIDLGPDGGDGGGRIVAVGSPEDIARTRGSSTGEFLRRILPELAA